MPDVEKLRQLIEQKEAELKELRDARPRASCAGKYYARAEDMTRAMHVESLEEELTSLKRQLAKARG